MALTEQSDPQTGGVPAASTVLDSITDSLREIEERSDVAAARTEHVLTRLHRRLTGGPQAGDESEADEIRDAEYIPTYLERTKANLEKINIALTDLEGIV